MNKHLIQERFAKNLNNYDNNALIQKLMAKKLLSDIATKNFNKILELGCGTGILTNLVYQKFKYNKYVANDIVSNCKQYIEKISSDIQFIQDDAENFITNNNENFDLIISNATFQWIENIKLFIDNLYSHLNKNGILLFSTFGTSNFKEIYQITHKSLQYKTVSEYKNLFSDKNITLKEEEYQLEFNTAKDILIHLKNTGVNSIEKTFWTKQDLKDFENKYKEICPKKLILTYNPIYVKIKK